jgi:hypothetical protein
MTGSRQPEREYQENKILYFVLKFEGVPEALQWLHA